MKCIRSDPGGEFVNDKTAQYLKRHGIIHQTTEKDTSVQNGKVERFHRTLFNTTRAMLWSSGMPTKFWGDALIYASTMRKYLPTRGNSDRRSPLEVLTDKVPNISHLLKVGARFTVRLQHVTAKSLRKRSEKAYILGIDTVNNGYNIYLPRTKTYLTSPTSRMLTALTHPPLLNSSIHSKRWIL